MPGMKSGGTPSVKQRESVGESGFPRAQVGEGLAVPVAAPGQRR